MVWPSQVDFDPKFGPSEATRERSTSKEDCKTLQQNSTRRICQLKISSDVRRLDSSLATSLHPLVHPRQRYPLPPLHHQHQRRQSESPRRTQSWARITTTTITTTRPTPHVAGQKIMAPKKPAQTMPVYTQRLKGPPDSRPRPMREVVIFVSMLILSPFSTFLEENFNPNSLTCSVFLTLAFPLGRARRLAQDVAFLLQLPLD